MASLVSFEAIYNALDEDTVAREASKPHDEARIRFYLKCNTVSGWHELRSTLTTYTKHHVAACRILGGVVSDGEAESMAMDFLEREYRRRGQDVSDICHDAVTGLNGGMHALLNIICEGFRTQSTDRYVRHVFRAAIDPRNFEERLEIIRQLVSRLGPDVRGRIDTEHPERYAGREYADFVQAYVGAVQRMKAAFRRS